MAAMTTALTEFSNNGNSRTYTLSGHSALVPKLVLQKRRVPVGSQTVAEDTITVLSATTDADSAVIPQRVTFSVTVRRPVEGDAADVTAMLAVFRDVIAGDEFANTVATQEFLV